MDYTEGLKNIFKGTLVLQYDEQKLQLIIAFSATGYRQARR